MVTGMILTVLSISMLTLTLNAQPIKTGATTQGKTGGVDTESFVATDWNKTYGATGLDEARSVVQTSDGGYALAGYTSAGGYDFWLVKTDYSGAMQWNKTYGSGTGAEYAYSMVQTSDGGYALAGIATSFGAGHDDFWLVKTDYSGAMQWNKTYGATGYDDASSVVQTSDGGYAVAGETDSFGAGNFDFWLVKTDSSGAMQWNKTYGGTLYEKASSAVQTSDGGYAVAGYTNSFGAGSYDFWLVKTDSTGAMQWNKTYGGASTDLPSSVVQTSDGGYALAGYTNSFGAGADDFWLVKTDSSGAMQWNKTYGGTSGDNPYSVVQTSDGGYALAGSTNSFGAGNYDFWLVKTDSTGAMQWNKTYGGASTDNPSSVLQTSDGGYAVAGYTNSFGAGNFDFWLIKLTPSIIYINPDGSVYPSTAPFQRNGSLYTFTENIYTTADVGIMIERNDVTLNGAGLLMDGGARNNTGIWLDSVTNVTVKNVNLQAFSPAIYLAGTSKSIIVDNNVTGCPYGIELLASSYNTLTGNHVTNSTSSGILLCQGEGVLGSPNNTLTGNTLTNNTLGISLSQSSSNYLSENTVEKSSRAAVAIYTSNNNTLVDNNITASYEGIQTNSSLYNAVYHNNFVANSHMQVDSYNSTNSWDDGYPSGGNYWSDYNGTDVHSGPDQNETGSDGIGDTPFVIDVNNHDNYPLMQTWSPQYTRYSWPMFRQNPVHTGCTESPAPNTNQLQWNYTTTGVYVFSSPAIFDGKVYVGSSDGRFYCFDASTGRPVWNSTTGNWIVSSPAVANGRVYVGSDDGRVYCLDAATGTQVWNYSTGSPVSSSPAVVDGKVYVGSYDNKIYCLDAATGLQAWNYTTGGTVYSSPAVIGGKVFMGSEDNKVYCLNAASGMQVWNYTTGSVVDSSPAVVDGKVYVGSNDNRVYCLDAATGLQVWNYTTGNWVGSSPAVANGRVYVGSDDGRVYCLDAATGTQVWNYSTGSGVSPSSAAVAGGKVFVGSSNHNVYCLDAGTGTQVWNYTTGSVVYSSPAVADGVVYVSSEDGSVYAFGNVIRVPEDYATIQAAINAASPGATIWIDPGVYHESLVVNKTITLIGKPGSEPIFNGGGSGIAINITSAGSGSTIAGITITSWDQGIIVQNANSCKIYDNIMTLINNNAIAFQGTSAVNNQVYGNIFQQDIVAVDLASSSYNNTITRNVVTLSTTGLKLETSGNVVCENMISNNQLGLTLINSDNNTIYHNDFIDNTYAVQLSFTTSTGNKWDDGYPQGGNFWKDYSSVDLKSGPNQNIPGGDGVGDTPYTIAVNNTDNYPLIKPFNEHNIGITGFIIAKTVIFQGFACNITVSILNYGLHDETFNLAIWANQTRICLQPMVLLNRSSIQMTFVWNTTGLPYGRYMMMSVVDTVPGEMDMGDNTVTGFVVWVSGVGDLTGGTPSALDFVPDKKVDITDVAITAKFFGQKAPPAPANCDVTGPTIGVPDGKVQIDDVATVSKHFGQHYTYP
jgi:parallel beta-helix repeat protein